MGDVNAKRIFLVPIGNVISPVGDIAPDWSDQSEETEYVFPLTAIESIFSQIPKSGPKLVTRPESVASESLGMSTLPSSDTSSATRQPSVWPVSSCLVELTDWLKLTKTAVPAGKTVWLSGHSLAGLVDSDGDPEPGAGIGISNGGDGTESEGGDATGRCSGIAAPFGWSCLFTSSCKTSTAGNCRRHCRPSLACSHLTSNWRSFHYL